MRRTKHTNIPTQFITLITLCLCYALTMYLSLAPAYAVPPPPQPYYIVDAYQTPGTVYKIQNRTPGIFFKRRSGNISSIAVYTEQLFFCSANDNRIYAKKIKGPERVVFEHNTYIRDVAVDPNGNLHFSEASGAGDNGRICKLSPRIGDLESGDHFSISPERAVSVYLRTVDRFWAGDFTFDARGDLYLSSGNRSPAFIYRVPKEEGGQYGPPRKLYKDAKGAIKGIAIDPSNSDFIYYADWNQTIHKLNLRYLGRSREFSRNIAESGNPHLSDIAFDISPK